MSLKSKNIPYVLIFLFLSYIAFAYSNDLSWSFFREVKFENGSFELKDPLIGAALHLFGIIVVQLIPSNVKHIIVFLRFRNPLPGSRVFSDLIKKDTRTSLTDLEKHLGKLPVLPEEQNALWYKIYKTKQNDEVVSSSHQNFLLFRDLLAIALLIFPPSVFYSLFASINFKSIIYLAGSLTVTVVLWIVAYNCGNRFACNVITR